MLKAERAGATPESSHLMVMELPATREAPAAGEVNSTSATTDAARALSAVKRPKRIVETCVELLRCRGEMKTAFRGFQVRYSGPETSGVGCDCGCACGCACACLCGC